MKEYSKAFVTAALLLLLGGCATTAADLDAGADQEVEALGQAFKDQMGKRYMEHRDMIVAGKAELAKKPAAAHEWTRDDWIKLVGIAETQGRINFIENFKKPPAGVTFEQWCAGEAERISRESNLAERDLIESTAQLKAWKAGPNLPLAQQVINRAFRVDELRGEKLEAELFRQKVTTYHVDRQAIYQDKDRKIAEYQAQAQAGKQSLLLFLGGLQQINHNLQEQARYNQHEQQHEQQQRQQLMFQNQIIHELNRPITCLSYGAAITCN